ncbi:hypothetical protein OH491_24630 [Termitidicoccus mucosus]
MPKIILLLFVAIVPVGLWASAGHEVPSVAFEGHGVDVTHYLTIGPFELSGNDNAGKLDYLRGIGLHEKIQTSALFNESLGKVDAEASRDGGYFRTIRQGAVDINYAYGRGESRLKKGEMAYVVFNIVSEKETTAWMLVDSNGPSQVLLNGAPIFHAKKGEVRIFMCSDAIKIPLRKGSNLVLAKVVRNGAPWVFSAHITSSAENATETAIARQAPHEKFLLEKNIHLSAGNGILLAPKGAPSSVDISGIVESAGGIKAGVIEGRRVRWNDGSVADGLYSVVLDMDGKRYYERFLVGDPIKAATEALKRIKSLDLPDGQKAHFEILSRRLYSLGREYITWAKKIETMPNAPEENRSWERGFLQALWETEEAMSKFQKGEEPFAHATGLHWRGFTSAIDGSLQAYRIFVPSSYGDQGQGRLPLCAILPTLTSISRSFLDSKPSHDHDLASRLAALAEKHQIILLWPGYHNQPAGMPMESAHLGEVLDAVGNDYQFDGDRICLLGMCSAAAFAFDADTDWPGRFAGIALLNPVFRINKTMSEEVDGHFKPRKEYKEWKKIHSVSSYLESKNTPVFMINDGGEAGHGQLEESLRFMSNAARVFAPVKLEIRPRTQFKQIGSWDELIQWASLQKAKASATRHERVRKDSIQDALTEKFTIIMGTAGSERENKANAEIAARLQKTWRELHYSECGIARDADMAAPESLRDQNIVLIGGPESNAVWKLLSSRMDVQLSEDGIAFDGKHWEGNNLSIQAVVRNPLNNERRIVLMGGPHLASDSFGTFALSKDGWFKYAIWKPLNGKASLHDAGMDFTSITDKNNSNHE